MCPPDAWQQHKDEIEGRLIHRSRDDWGEIWVVDHGDHRKLLFGSPFEQSCLDLAAPWRPVHEYARAVLLALGYVQPDDVLMFGLGGGVLVHAIQHCFPDAHFQVVELREQVVDIAREYFSLPQSENVVIRVDDVRHVLREMASDSADLLITDLFHHSTMHPLQRQGKFFAHCRRILRENGWLAINCDHLDDPLGADLRVLCRYFPTVLMFESEDGNQIVLAGKTCPEDSDLAPNRWLELESRLGLPLMAMSRRLKRIVLQEG